MPDDPVLVAQERLALKKMMDGTSHGGDFAIPFRKVDENVLLATWNVQNFSEKKEDRAIQYMADIVERFDIVAIQELKTDLRGLSSLQRKLPGHYRVLVSDPTGNHERFAFIYDARTIEATGLVCEVSFNVPGSTHTGFQLHRTPYCASFRAGRFDFVVTSVHIFQSGTTMREEEIDEIARHMAHRATRPRFKVFDRDFLLVGDFNIEKTGDRFFEALASHGFRMPPRMNELKTNFNLDQTFDKIAWFPSPAFEFQENCNIVPFMHALYQDRDPAGGKQEISDHVPLWVELTIQELSHQLDQIINAPGD